jgi:hypothetical protein
MEENKKKIVRLNSNFGKKGKKYFVTAGLIATMAAEILASKGQDGFINKAQAQEMNINDDEKSSKTDLEKYFTCEVPMDEDYKVTTQSPIYKILEFYEKGTAPEGGYYVVEKDPKGLLVIGNGMTLKYQQEILDYLSNYGSSNTEIISNVTKLVNSGEQVKIPETVIVNATLNAIQECRSNAIEAAKKYNINLSEIQINVLTEMNYRYGDGQAEKLFKSLAEGKNLRDFEVSNQKPFNGIEMDSSLENLKNINIKDETAKADNSTASGDIRRCLTRQILIEDEEYFYEDGEPEYLICIDSKGTFRNIETGENINIVDYLEEKTAEKEENANEVVTENNQTLDEVNEVEITRIDEEDVQGTETYTDKNLSNTEEKTDESSNIVESNEAVEIDELDNDDKEVEIAETSNSTSLDKKSENTSLPVSTNKKEKNNIFAKIAVAFGVIGAAAGALFKNKKDKEKETVRRERMERIKAKDAQADKIYNGAVNSMNRQKNKRNGFIESMKNYDTNQNYSVNSHSKNNTKNKDNTINSKISIQGR